MMRVVRSRRVLGHGAASVQVRDGRIEAIAAWDALPPGAELLDFGDDVVMPAVVDTHVHVNEPGRTEWEGFRSATRSAAAGGIGTIVDMPLNSLPVTTTARAFRDKLEAARGQLAVDVGFWGGVVPGNTGELAAMVEAGVLGFKCFMVDSGIPEFGRVDESQMRAAMRELQRLQSPLLVHAEVAGPLREPEGPAEKYSTYLHTRPRASENEAVALAARLCAETRARTHIVHHSSSDALATLREARAAGAPLSAETCPHYLRFAAEDIPDRRTEFKCAPPIRERDNREALWRALGEGVLDMIASDHSPCSTQLKSARFDEAWGGVSGLQLALPVTWTEAHKRGHSLEQVAQWMCAAPARLAGLQRRKGALAAGLDADLCVFRPEEAFLVDPQKLSHRHKLTPYAGQELRGVVVATFVRGALAYHRGDFPGQAHGEELLRE
ncbi:MAG TPA: allantoinase AllB [Myxococcales bacterium]|nr:allantoinase AllB [Myxococcales bacterium]